MKNLKCLEKERSRRDRDATQKPRQRRDRCDVHASDGVGRGVRSVPGSVAGHNPASDLIRNKMRETAEMDVGGRGIRMRWRVA